MKPKKRLIFRLQYNTVIS